MNETYTSGSSGFAESADQDNVRLTADQIRSTRETLDDSMTRSQVKQSPYKRFSESIKNGELKEILANPKVRTGGIAAAALIVGSFMYQHHKKKDRSIEDLTGPPLLPGGSPYEEYNTATSRAQMLKSLESQANQVGVQYKINTSGSSQDLNRLRGIFGGVTNGPINTTMYSGLQRLGQDPYRQVGSSF